VAELHFFRLVLDVPLHIFVLSLRPGTDVSNRDEGQMNLLRRISANFKLYDKGQSLFWESLRGRYLALSGGLFLLLICKAAAMALPLSMRFLIDNVVGQRQTGSLLPIILVMLAANIVQGVTSYAASQVFSMESQRAIFHLRCKVQAHVSQLPLAFHENNKTGGLASRIMTDIDGVRNLLSIGVAQFVGSIFTAGYGLIYVLSLSVELTAAALLGLGLYSLITKWQLKYLNPLFAQAMESRQHVQGRLQESLSGIRVLKAYQAEQQDAQIFVRGCKTLQRDRLRIGRRVSLVSAVNATVLGMIMLVITFLAIRQILQGTLTVGGFVTFNAIVTYLFGPAVQFSGMTQMVGEAFGGLQRTQELLQEKTEHENPRRQNRLEAREVSVSFEKVSFSYDGRVPVLHDINFEAPPGTVTALVGPSGGGKSTIISLIAAFRDPSQGIIRVNGSDLSTIQLDSYRSGLGVVFQDTFLFDGSIRENVALARPTAKEAEIIEACRIAHVHQFATQMPDGYDTRVGERGIKLSGGQQQRIAIARAILASPRILIFDEATSNLDSESESAIQQAMAYLLQGRTTFVIAHRLSTIQRANQIFVIEGGRITERGTHALLLAARGRYCDLYTRQFAAPEVTGAATTH
jgi:ABC-type multidrug transport system fused ATPase/permease subunit